MDVTRSHDPFAPEDMADDDPRRTAQHEGELGHDEARELADMAVPELVAIAKAYNVSGALPRRKADLVALIERVQDAHRDLAADQAAELEHQAAEAVEVNEPGRTDDPPLEQEPAPSADEERTDEKPVEPQEPIAVPDELEPALEDLTKAQLQVLAARYELNVPAKATKPALVAAIEAHEAAGDVDGGGDGGTAGQADAGAENTAGEPTPDQEDPTDG